MHPEVFPYRATPPPPLPRFARYRCEGQPPLHCLLHVVDYIRKYKNKVWAASDDVVAHFAAQRRLLESVASRPCAGPTIAFVGDLMWIRDGWEGFLDSGVLDHLNSHEAVVGNLETLISPRVAVAGWLPDRLRFNSRPELLTSFRRPDGRNTFSALSLANNHALDFGPGPLLDTLGLLEREGVVQSGVRRAEGREPFAILRCGDLRVGFYAATWGEDGRETPGLRLNRIRGLERPEGGADLSGARDALAWVRSRGADVCVVALHWGYEYEMFPTPAQMVLARELVSAGADFVVGSHPHVVQPVEVCVVNGYEAPADLPLGSRLTSPDGRPRKALIAYSLGNFTTAMFTLGCRVGLVASVRLHRRDDGSVDWTLEPWRLVLNVRRHPATGRRRLVLLEDYLRDHGERLRPRERRELARLRDHITWRVR